MKKDDKLLQSIIKSLKGKPLRQAQIEQQIQEDLEKRGQKEKEIKDLEKHKLELEEDKKRLFSKRIKELSFSEEFKGKFPCSFCGNIHTKIGFCWYKGCYNTPAFVGMFIECSKCKMSSRFSENENFLNKYTTVSIPLLADVKLLTEAGFKKSFSMATDPQKRKELMKKVKVLKIMV